MGMKDESGNWCISGHKNRIMNKTNSDIDLFGRLFDENYSDNDARLPVLHASQFLEILRAFSQAPRKLLDYGNSVVTSEMWNETSCTKSWIISKNVHFPTKLADVIYSGSHIGNANPIFKSSRAKCTKVSDFDAVDATLISSSYLQRMNYSPNLLLPEYHQLIIETPWGNKYTDNFRVVGRRMLDLKGAKTVQAAIIPPYTSHLNSIHGWAFRDSKLMVLFAGLMESNVYDFFIKIEGKDNLYDDNTKFLPLHETIYSNAIRIRALRLNCLTDNYSKLWSKVWNDEYKKDEWSLKDSRLIDSYAVLSPDYRPEFAFRSDYERRMALVELDVLAAMSIGLTLEQLQVLYSLSFFAAIQQENDTWYDSNGRIVFTNNRALTGVGVDRKIWETQIKPLKPGEKYKITVNNNYFPEGTREQNIFYLAPFNKCNRESEYEIVWRYFEERFSKQ